MNIRKAVITAAGPGQQTLPLQTLVDRDGVEKKALRIILEEVIHAGVDEVGLVTAPGVQAAYTEAAGDYAGRVHFMEQASPRGYGHALGLARAFVGGQPFLHLVSDHLYVSSIAIRSAQQVVEAAVEQKCAVSSVLATRESMLPYYGTVAARRTPRRSDLYEIENVIEKPTPSEAEQKLLVPGLRAGHYLCLYGIHVFTPTVLDLLEEQEARTPVGESLPLSPVLAQLASRERYLALEVRGRRYNIGVKYGLLTAQLALALDGADRDNVLSQLVELLAQGRTGKESGLGSPRSHY
jgi:UTP--glucose-1-phosphate uridylyltransferase